MLALIDGANFYCSCERVFRPELNGRPLVVLSSNDGACIARSDEAKALGVQMAQPWFQVRHLQKSAGLVAVSANFELYGDMSSRMMAVEARFAPRQEIYSIDESFLDFSGMRVDLVETGRRIRSAVLKEVGIPCGVGFGPTKTLAKLANHVSKSAERKPGSYPAQYAQVCDFGRLSDLQVQEIFARTEVGDVWGVGRKLRERLNQGGIRTVLDLVRADTGSIRKQFSVVLEKTVQELRGTPCLQLDDVPSARQQILVSRSFGTSITSADGIVEAVSEFASRAAERLRQQDSVASAIQVFFSTSPFRENERQHSPTLTVPLSRPTADSRILVRAAATAARHAFRPGFNYSKAGVMLVELLDKASAGDQAELDLFGAADAGEGGLAQEGQQGRPALMEAMDALNRRFGRDAVRIGSTKLASAGSDVSAWATRQERRTPRWTTRLDEIPVVKT